VLLLARPDDLWDTIRPQLPRSVDFTDPLVLRDFTPERYEAYQEAVAAFAGSLDVSYTTMDAPPDLDSDVFRAPLDLHMAALAAVCAHRDNTPVPEHADLSTYLFAALLGRRGGHHRTDRAGGDVVRPDSQPCRRW
jgi:hypothetical protein